MPRNKSEPSEPVVCSDEYRITSWEDIIRNHGNVVIESAFLSTFPPGMVVCPADEARVGSRFMAVRAEPSRISLISRNNTNKHLPMRAMSVWIVGYSQLEGAKRPPVYKWNETDSSRHIC